MDIGAAGYPTDYYRAHVGVGLGGSGATTEKINQENFKDEVHNYKAANRLKAQELKEDKDWRKMADDEWDKMLEGVDEYTNAFKERLKQMKEMQDEAAQKAAMAADPEMRAIAASSAALNVSANGFDGFSSSKNKNVEGIRSTEESVKKNWTKKLKTDGQTIIKTAEAKRDVGMLTMFKLQEVQLTDNTVVGISQTETVTECASVWEDDNNGKIWEITAFTEQGIVSNKCQNGKIIDSWELKYTNQEEAERVGDFLAKFEKDADLKFSGSQEFWEEFRCGKVDGNGLFAAHEAAFDKCAPDAPQMVKKAWMEAARESGHFEGGKMDHISQVLVHQAENRVKGVADYQNVFGHTVASALQAAKDMLYDLENPLTPISERGENIGLFIEQEKQFYRKFIDRLEDISSIGI